MGRPLKTGLEYFPMDVYFFEDEKIEAIAMDFGAQGEITAIKLLCLIYRNGYYVEWNEPMMMKMRRLLPGMSMELIQDVVNRLLRWNYFNQELYEQSKVLTSRAIQLQYREITKRRKQSNAHMPYWMLETATAPPKPTKNEQAAALLHAEKGLIATSCAERKAKKKENGKEKESIKEKDGANAPLAARKKDCPSADVVLTDACMDDVQQLMRFFGYNEQNNFNIMRHFSVFIAVLHREKRLPYFRKQFAHYCAYKQCSKERIHSWKGYTGSADDNFAKGGWDANNWELQLNNWRAKHQQDSQPPSHMLHKGEAKNTYCF